MRRWVLVMCVAVSACAPRARIEPSPMIPDRVTGSWHACFTFDTTPPGRQTCGVLNVISLISSSHSQRFRSEYAIQHNIDLAFLVGDSNGRRSPYGVLEVSDGKWKLLLGVPEGVSYVTHGGFYGSARPEADSLVGSWSTDRCYANNPDTERCGAMVIRRSGH